MKQSNLDTQKAISKNNFADQPESFTKLKWPSLKKKDKDNKFNKNSKNIPIKKRIKNNSYPQIGAIQPAITKSVTNNEENTLQNIKEKLAKRPKVKNITESELILIHRDLLPKKFLNLMKVKEALKRGDALTITDALEEYDVSSGTYSKYRYSIIPFYEATKEKIFTLIFEVEQEENVLTKIVTMISKHFGEILTLNKGFPVNRISSISISFDTNNLDIDFDVLLSKLEALNGVRSMQIMGRINNTVMRKTNKLNKNTIPDENDKFNKDHNHSKFGNFGTKFKSNNQSHNNNR